MIDTTTLKAMMQPIAAQYLHHGQKASDHIKYICPFHKEEEPSFAVYTDHFHCYGCGIKGDVITFVQFLEKCTFQEACQKLGAGETDREVIDKYKAEREAERLALEAEKKDMRLEYSKSGRWQSYYEAMDEVAKIKWRNWGIPDSYQKWWKLGFTPDKVYEVDGAIAHSPAHVMPMWTFPNGVPSYVQTSQFRLANPAPGAGRFRFERGLGTAPFITRNDWKAGTVAKGPALCLVVEGPRKAATTRVLGADENIQVIGIPSKLDTGGILESLKLYEWVYVWLDPDVRFPPKNPPEKWEPADIRLCKLIGPNTSYIRYGEKIDDALLNHHLDRDDVARILRQSEQVL
jgi:hypothetical protein